MSNVKIMGKQRQQTFKTSCMKTVKIVLDVMCYKCWFTRSMWDVPVFMSEASQAASNWFPTLTVGGLIWGWVRADGQRSLCVRNLCSLILAVLIMSNMSDTCNLACEVVNRFCGVFCLRKPRVFDGCIAFWSIEATVGVLVPVDFSSYDCWT